VTRLADIQGHINSMEELLGIVGAMRSLAGMRVQEAQRALPGSRRYAESFVEAISAALLLMPEPPRADPAFPGRRALVLCTAEHGFVGGFNEHLIEAADILLVPADALFVLGTRGAALIADRGRAVAWKGPMASKPAGAPATINQLTAQLYRRIARREITRVEVMFGRARQGGAPSIQHHLLLPLVPAARATASSRQPPLHNLQPQALVENLIAEYIFARLTEAAVESIASENAARFAAMESAHDNVGKKLDQLRQERRQARQEEITAELLDLITGSGALMTDDRRRG
jgi:F-type H+-transporting ATPase subunit gamma